MNAILGEACPEVDEQAEAFVAQANIGEELLLVDRRDLFDGFQLNDDLVFNQKISPKALIKLDVVVANCRTPAKRRGRRQLESVFVLHGF